MKHRNSKRMRIWPVDDIWDNIQSKQKKKYQKQRDHWIEWVNKIKNHPDERIALSAGTFLGHIHFPNEYIYFGSNENMNDDIEANCIYSKCCDGICICDDDELAGKIVNDGYVVLGFDEKEKWNDNNKSYTNVVLINTVVTTSGILHKKGQIVGGFYERAQLNSKNSDLEKNNYLLNPKFHSSQPLRIHGLYPLPLDNLNNFDSSPSTSIEIIPSVLNLLPLDKNHLIEIKYFNDILILFNDNCTQKLIPHFEKLTRIIEDRIENETKKEELTKKLDSLRKECGEQKILIKEKHEKSVNVTMEELLKLRDREKEEEKKFQILEEEEREIKCLENHEEVERKNENTLKAKEVHLSYKEVLNMLKKKLEIISKKLKIKENEIEEIQRALDCNHEKEEEEKEELRELEEEMRLALVERDKYKDSLKIMMLETVDLETEKTIYDAKMDEPQIEKDIKKNSDRLENLRFCMEKSEKEVNLALELIEELEARFEKDAAFFREEEEKYQKDKDLWESKERRAKSDLEELKIEKENFIEEIKKKEKKMKNIYKVNDQKKESNNELGNEGSDAKEVYIEETNITLKKNISNLEEELQKEAKRQREIARDRTRMWISVREELLKEKEEKEQAKEKEKKKKKRNRKRGKEYFMEEESEELFELSENSEKMELEFEDEQDKGNEGKKKRKRPVSESDEDDLLPLNSENFNEENNLTVIRNLLHSSDIVSLSLGCDASSSGSMEIEELQKKLKDVEKGIDALTTLLSGYKNLTNVANKKSFLFVNQETRRLFSAIFKHKEVLNFFYIFIWIRYEWYQ
jgi:hypothetical protein